MVDIRDEQLVKDFLKTGDIRHFDELVFRHISRVRAMIYPMVFNDADADELTQDVFLCVIGNISRFQGKSLFSTWLYRITMNTVRNFLRRRNICPVSHHAEPPEQVDHSSNPAAGILIADSDSQVAKALAGLSPSLRAAITLTAINGMSVSEAAETEGCLMATMYWRVHHARKLLKKQLEGSLKL